ncbi:MAG: hypothetical protein ABW063_02765 [Caulobacter sp.]
MQNELAAALQGLRFQGYAPQTMLDWGAGDIALNQHFVAQFPHCAQTLANVEDLEQYGDAGLDEVVGGQTFDFIKIDQPYAALETLKRARATLRKADYILIRAALTDGEPEALFEFFATIGFRSSEAVSFHRTSKGKTASVAVDLLFERRVQRPTQNLRYTSLYDRQDLLAYLKAQQAACSDFTVIDVGASGHPWTHEVVSATFDYGAATVSQLHFQGDFNDPRQWDSVLKHVAKHGRFSYCVCSHTLEDLSNPEIALEMLPKIAEAGYISTPSRFLELARPEDAYRGFIHHLWVLDDDKNELVITPKLPVLDYLQFQKDLAASPEKFELQMTWRNGITYRRLGPLGPTRQAVIEMYQRFFDRP